MDTQAPLKGRILVVDDEESLREGLQLYLEMDGYSVATAADGPEALEQLPGTFDLVLLDVMMEPINGMEVAKRMKANHATAHIPIIFLTARDADEDMVAGLELGADDYISKPFSMKNVLARISAVLRRSAFARAHEQVSGPTNTLSRLGIVIDFDAHVCSVDGTPVKMPRKELEILTLLLQNPGTIFSREDILKRLWPDEVIVLERVVDVNITRLRKKLSPYGTHIVTRSGFGYGWQD